MTQYYFYNAGTPSDGDLGYSGNWWLDAAHITPLNRTPEYKDTATLLSSATSGQCNASSITVPLNVKFGSAASTTGDLIVSQMNDYLSNGSPESCSRISIDGGKTFYGPTRYWFKATSASANLGSLAGWYADSNMYYQSPQLPGPNDIAIIPAPGIANCEVSGSFTCGMLFNLSGKVGWSTFAFTGALVDNPTNLLNCMVNGPYNARNLYLAQNLRFAEFNGPAYFTSSRGQASPLTIIASTPNLMAFTFNGDVAIDATNLFIDSLLPSSVIGKGNRFSCDYGLTWNGPSRISPNDIRFGVNRGDGQLGKCYVPTPAQVQKGVLVDVSSVGSLVVSNGLTASNVQTACVAAIKQTKQTIARAVVKQMK